MLGCNSFPAPAILGLLTRSLAASPANQLTSNDPFTHPPHVTAMKITITGPRPDAGGKLERSVVLADKLSSGAMTSSMDLA